MNDAYLDQLRAHADRMGLAMSAYYLGFRSPPFICYHPPGQESFLPAEMFSIWGHEGDVVAEYAAGTCRVTTSEQARRIGRDRLR